MTAKKTNIPVSTDPRHIDEVLSRSVDSVFPSKEQLKKELLSGKQLRVYVGIDPTAPYVHLGHSTNFFLLKRLHTLGHKIIVLVGDFTAMIGDPSDKSAARLRLSAAEVKKNLATYKEQIGKILDFKDTKNQIEFKFNSAWLSKLTFTELADIASNFTVQQMIQRDAFERRLRENKPLYVHEFFYPLMQGYDSVALEADIEIGGTDQTFNMLAGRTLVQKLQGREKFVITTTLLEDPTTGEKMMSKSRGTGIGMNDAPKDMYAKVMRLPDAGLSQCFVDCTELPKEEIVRVLSLPPREAKMRLAREIVTLYHSATDAKNAEEEFVRVFSNKELPQDIQEAAAGGAETLEDILIREGMAPSRSEVRRLVEGGGLKDAETGKKIDDPKVVVSKPIIIKIGKKKFLKIVFKMKRKEK